MLIAPGLARADHEETALVVDATFIAPETGVHAGAAGVGGELRFFDDHELMTGSFGAFAAYW